MIVSFEDKNIKIKKSYNEIHKFFTFTAISKNNKIMATLTFKKDSNNSHRIWLNKIRVEEKFSHNGAASALMYALEDFALKNRVFYIEGKFYPENEYAKPFYEKLGYEIYKEDYETYVGKFLNKTNNNIKIIETEDDILSF